MTQTNQSQLYMKVKKRLLLSFVALLFCFQSAAEVHAQDSYVGLWNFDEADLSASAGEDMEYLDDTGDIAEFGTTESLAIPGINGEIANVLKLPKLTPEQGLKIILPEASNGEGDLVNNWTAIMDIYYPLTSSGKKRALIEIVSDEWVAGAGDAEFYVSANNGIGTAGFEVGTLTPGEWHRVVMVMNVEGASEGLGTGKLYIDGDYVGGTAVPADALDGRWSLDTAFELSVALFQDDNNESEEVIVSSVQLRFDSLNAGQIGALGGPQAAGVPKELPDVPSFVTEWIPSAAYANADTGLGVVIDSGDTVIGGGSFSLSLNGNVIASEVTEDEGVFTVTASGDLALAKASKYELKVTYTDSLAGEKSFATKFEIPVYFENFDSVVLGPNIDEAVASEEAWSPEGPEGWIVDRSGVPGNDEEHVGYLPDDDGDGFPDADGVSEWAGWSFANFDWWVQAAGDQSRSSFNLASNTVAVADPDEWDDQSHADSAQNGWFKTLMTTPEIDVQGMTAGTLFATFASSWRPEFDSNYHQEAYITVSYDGAEPLEIFNWVSDPNSPNFHPDSQNETVIVPLDNPEGSKKMSLSFGMREAGNDWWWAIDNLVVNAGVVPPTMVSQPNNVEIGEGEGFSVSALADGGAPLSYQWFRNGVLIEGATSAEFSIAQAGVSDAGNYTVKVTNEAGEILSSAGIVSVQASLGVTVWSEDFEGLELGPNVDEGLAGEQVWTKTPPAGWFINDEEVPGTWAWQGLEDEEGYPELDGVTEWAGWSIADVKWWSQTAGNQRRSEFKKAIGAAAIADGDEWDDSAREGGNMNAFITTEPISLDGIMENSLVLRFHSSWRPEVLQKAVIEATFDDGDPIEIMRWESEGGDAAYYHDHNPNETVNISINNPDGAGTVKFTFGYLDAGNNWWWAVDNLILAGEPKPIFAENFDGLELGGFESSTESGGDGTDWTATAPTGWVTAKADDHGPTADGEAVKEFDGWTFLDPVSWNATAGQDRAEFTKGTGVIAVGDSDEYDDAADAKFNASLSTPAFSLDGVKPGTAILVYDSSWRQEPQSGKVTVSFDGGEQITLLELSPDTPTAYNETVTLPLGNPEGAKEAVITWDHQGYNNWWWAIDNIKVTVGKAPPVITSQPASVEAFEGESVSLSVNVDGDEPLFYTWYKDGEAIAGQEGPVLELNQLTEDNSGAYSLSVGNSAGDANSNPATVSVLLNPGSTSVFSENFDSLELEPFVSDSESGGDGTDWTAAGPEGWSMIQAEDHGPTAEGDDVVEFDGWTFLDPVSWNATAGQDRGQFTKGTGVVAVGDSDEYDDKADAKFNASLSTPAISIVGYDPGSLILKYDSSWRQEPQQGKVLVSYDGAEPTTLLELTPDTPTGYNDTVTLRLNNPEGAQSVTVSWDHQGHNNWWWAIDNIEITGELQPLYSENFDSLELGPFVSDSESGGDGTDWTAEAPIGWVVKFGDGHGPTAGGDDVVEFDGWTFLDPVSWNATAGQDRAQFTKGTGVIAVGDSDEYDDKADAKFNASLSTPSISLAGVQPNSLVVRYDSSWRQEPQAGKVTISFDGADPVTLLELTPDTPTAYNETVVINVENPEGASSAVISWDHQGHNNWWWAIDNIVVYSKAPVSQTLPEGVYFAENFDSLDLEPFVSDSESGGDGTDWTAAGPTGWVVTQAADHGPTAGGDDVVEFDGWTFLDPVSWNATAGQDRSQFTKGTGVIAVGDSDEYDDKADAKFNASLSTPSIDISGAGENQLLLVYDSSWRQEPQSGKVLVSFDGGEQITLLELNPDTPTAYNETVELELNNPAGASSAVITWDHQGYNNWWWAIDNITVKAKPSGPGPNDPKLVTDKTVYLTGETVNATFNNGQGNAKDWVGIYRPDMTPGTDGSLKWSYVGGTQTAGEGLTEGTIEFAHDKLGGPLSAGDYVAIFFVNDTYEQMATVEFTLVDPPSVTTTRSVYTSGSPITVEFSNGPGNAKDWVGLYRPDMTPGEVGSLKWLYVNGTQTSGDGFTDGSVTLEGLEPGKYYAIFFENDGYTQLATTVFNVLGADDIYFEENFDSLELEPFLSDSESGGDGTDWTAEAPTGWVVAFGDDHGPTAGGDDVVEFDGWTFLDPVSWNATAGQDRAQFTKGTGVIAVGDSDEYDDKADAKFNASLVTPEIDVSSAAAGSLVLTYDSSWRQEPQQGKVLVSYDGAEPVTLLELTPDTPTGYNETVTLSLNNPDGAQKAVITWDHQGYNNWWWAIDNIIVIAGEAGGGSDLVINSIIVDGGVLTLNWAAQDGVKLQSASSVNGPWTDVDGTAGKESHSGAADQAAAFYRLSN